MVLAWSKGMRCMGSAPKDEALTLLSVYHQVYEIQAIAEADAYTSISGGAKAPEGKILLGGGIYETGDSGADSLLGQNVRAYVKDTDQEKRVLSAFPYRSVNMKFTPDQLDPETKPGSRRALNWMPCFRYRQRPVCTQLCWGDLPAFFRTHQRH